MTIGTARERVGEAPEQKGRKAVDWTPILADQAANPHTSLSIIAGRHGVGVKALSAQVQKLETEPVDRLLIIERLVRLVQWQVVDLQREMNTMQAEDRRSGEREVALLGKIATNLEKLMELDGSAPSSGRRARSRPKDIVDLRSKLIERIEHLKRQ